MYNYKIMMTFMVQWFFDCFMAEEKLQKKTENHEDLEISNVKLRIP